MQLNTIDGNKLQSLIVNLISIYKRLASPRSINGVQSQLLTLLKATSQTTNERQFIPRSKLVKLSSTQPGVLVCGPPSGYLVHPSDLCSVVSSTRAIVVVVFIILRKVENMFIKGLVNCYWNWILIHWFMIVTEQRCAVHVLSTLRRPVTFCLRFYKWANNFYNIELMIDNDFFFSFQLSSFYWNKWNFTKTMNVNQVESVDHFLLSSSSSSSSSILTFHAHSSYNHQVIRIAWEEHLLENRCSSNCSCNNYLTFPL